MNLKITDIDAARMTLSVKPSCLAHGAAPVLETLPAFYLDFPQPSQERPLEPSSIFQVFGTTEWLSCRRFEPLQGLDLSKACTRYET